MAELAQGFDAYGIGAYDGVPTPKLAEQLGLKVRKPAGPLIHCFILHESRIFLIYSCYSIDQLMLSMI